MLYTTFRMTIISLLVFAIICAPLSQCLAEAKKKVQVAFVGIKFEDLSDDVQKRLLQRTTELLTDESALEVIEPKETQERLGLEQVESFFNQPDQAAYHAVAEQLQVDHVFAGQISGKSQEDRTYLIGELKRYDRNDQLLHRFEILKYYSNIGVELVKFREEFVKTIAPEVGDKNRLALYVLGGVAIVGVIALTLAGFEGSGSSSGRGANPDVP